jgi:hypothetical protein
MGQLPIEQHILLLLEIAVLPLLCIRVWAAGLHKIYAFFFGYLVLEFFQALIPMVVPLRSLLYRDLFVCSQGLIVAFYVLVVMELYSKALRDLAGIAAVARRFLRIALVLGAVFSALLFRMEQNTGAITGYLFVFERTVMSILVIFLFLIAGFLVYYPVPLGRNVIAYLAGYSAYLLTTATVALINNVGYSWNRLLGGINMAVSLACFLLWLLVLTSQGERRRVVLGHQWNPGDEGRLLAQLEAINASLLRSSRK